MNQINVFLAKPFFTLAGLDITPALIVLVLLLYMVFLKK